MRRKGLLLIVLVVLALGLCIFALLKNGKHASRKEPFRFAVVTWVNHGPFYLAREKGFYDKYNLKVDIQKIEDIGAQKLALQSGRLDGTISSVDFFATAAAEGVAAKTIMKLGAGNGADAIIASRKIRDISSLVGHSIAFEKGSPSHFFLLVALDEKGLTSRAIQPRYMTAADAGAAYVAGRVDACVTWEPWVTNAIQHRPSNVLATSRDRSGYLVDTFVVRDEILQRRRGDVISFMKAWFDAIEYWKAHPQESNFIMARGLGIPVKDLELMLKGVKLADYQDNLLYFGPPGQPGQYWSVFQRANRVYKAEGIINNPGDPQKFTNLSFLWNLYR